MEPTEGPAPSNRFIAIITTKDRYYNYGDDVEHIVSSITDWSEVTEEEYQLLNRFCSCYDTNTQSSFRVIERLDANSDFIPRTIEKFKALAAAEEKKAEAARKAEQKRRDEAEAKKAQKRAQKLLTQKARTEADERALLEELRQKYAPLSPFATEQRMQSGGAQSRGPG